MSRVAADFFERLYAADADPWRFESSEYERRKYALTLASLPDDHYRAGYEPGCSIGVLTEQLADRCDRLVATDVVPSAVARASARLAGNPRVSVGYQSLPDQWPDGRFDLIVISELGYYFPVAELDTILDRSLGSLDSGGTLVAVHWRGATDYPLTGDQVHRRIDGRVELQGEVCHEERRFLLGCWKKRDE